MDQNILDRASFLIERADVPCAFPPQNTAENLAASAAAALMGQQMLSVFLAGFLLSASDYTLKFNCR